MKLIGRYHEFSINEIMLYGTDADSLKGIIARPGVDVIVKEYRPKKKKRERKIYDPKTKEYRMEIEVIPPNLFLRHQVLATQDLGYAKVSIYSYPMDTHQVERLGLKPIEAATKKERTAEAVDKLTDHQTSLTGRLYGINPVGVSKRVWRAGPVPKSP